jgi:hypothetical protein
MSSSIGNLALRLSVNAVDFASGIDTAHKKVSAFAGDLSKKFGAIPFLGQLGGLGGLGGSIGIAGAGAWIEKSAGDLVNLSNQAHKYGITMRDAATFEVLAGGNAEAMTHALDHLSRGIGAVKQGAGGDFAKTLQSIGLAPKDLLSGTTAQAYKTITDRINSLGDANLRADATHKIFGKGADEIQNVINRGAAGFEAAAQKVDKYGLAIADADADQLRMTMRTIAESKLALKGAGRQGANFFAPVAGLAANLGATVLGSFSDLAHGDVAGAYVGRVKEAFGHLAKATDPKRDVEALREEMRQGGSAEVLGAGNDAVQEMTQSLTKHINTLTQGAAAAEIFAAKEQLIAAGLNPAKADQMFASVERLAEAQEKLGEVLSSSAKGMDIFREARRKLGELAQLEKTGVITPEQWDATALQVAKRRDRAATLQRAEITDESTGAAGKYAERIDYLNRLFTDGQRLTGAYTQAVKSATEAFGKSIGVDLIGPLDTFQDKVDQLMQASDLSESERASGLGQLAKQFIEQSGQGGETKLPGFLSVGSADFANFQARLDTNAALGGWQERLLAAQTAAQAKLDEQIKVGREILTAIKDRGRTTARLEIPGNA